MKMKMKRIAGKNGIRYLISGARGFNGVGDAAVSMNIIYRVIFVLVFVNKNHTTCSQSIKRKRD